MTLLGDAFGADVLTIFDDEAVSAVYNAQDKASPAGIILRAFIRPDKPKERPHPDARYAPAGIGNVRNQTKLRVWVLPGELKNSSGVAVKPQSGDSLTVVGSAVGPAEATVVIALGKPMLREKGVWEFVGVV